MGEIASAHVSIYPKFAGNFGSTVKNEVGKAGTQGGTAFVGGFSKSTKGMAPALGGIKAGILGIVASATVGAAVGGFVELTGAASDLNETVNKSKVIFGDNYAAMDTWAQGAARSAGLSKQAALAAASGFGDMFSQLGFSSAAATDMSKSVVQMSADLGSFNNLGTDDVAQRISAAFRGEYDSLQLLIPNINAARVEQEALAETGKKSAKSLTAQEKAAAVLAIVQRDGARAMGDYAKTADDAANKQKTMAAQTENLKGRFGGLLAPIQTLALDGFEQLITVGEEFTGWLEKNPEVVAGFQAALELAGDALKGIGMAVGVVALPALAILVEGFAQAADGVAFLLAALGHVPGFEWATDASEKVSKIADGAHAAARGLEGATAAMWYAAAGAEGASGDVRSLNDVLAVVPGLTEARVVAPGAGPSTVEVDNFVNSLGTVPGLTKAEIRTLANLYGVQQVKAALASVQNKDIYITTYKQEVILGSRVASGQQGGILKADGGVIPGWSPHPRADNILIRATANEFMQPVSAHMFYGTAAMEAVRQRRATISFADGGSVGGSSVAGGGTATLTAPRRGSEVIQIVLDGRVVAETVRRHDRGIR